MSLGDALASEPWSTEAKAMLDEIGIPVETANEYVRAWANDLDERIRRANSQRRECEHQIGVAGIKLAEAVRAAESPRTRTPERHAVTIAKLEKRIASWQSKLDQAELALGRALIEGHEAFGSPPMQVPDSPPAQPWDATDWKPF